MTSIQPEEGRNEDDMMDCEHHMTAKQHAEAGIPFWKMLDCVYHGDELVDGGTFDEQTGKELSKRIADRLEGDIDEIAESAGRLWDALGGQRHD